MEQETIVALASGPLPSAIALVRISGPRVLQIVSQHLSVTGLDHRVASVCFLQHTDGKPIDEVVATHFAGPKSYTGEDVLELSLHGGRAVVATALDALTNVPGVRLAEPGEFSKRAVLAGKIDLVEAEGVADLVDAETDAQRAQALAQLGGAASGVFADWHRQLVEAMALIEVAVDFPDEEDAPDHTHDQVIARLDTLNASLRESLESAHTGMQIRDGIAVAIIGAPNAGKSSLLNQLAGRDAAIVTDIPGTTRDVIEVRLNLGGHLVRLSDTAGLRESDDPIETEGVRRAKALAQSSDVVIGVYDAAEHSSIPDFDGLEPDLIVANKSDLFGETKNVSRETLRASARTGEGIGALIAALTALIVQKTAAGPDALITRQRHLDAVAAARDEVTEAIDGLRSGIGAELVAENVRMAARSLERLLGRVDVEDVLGSIFSSFCIGK